MLVALYKISSLLLRARIAIDICMCVCVFVGHTSIHVSIYSADPSRGMREKNVTQRPHDALWLYASSPSVLRIP